MNAGSAECATAYPGCDFPALEVAEEFLPLLLGGDPVLIGGPLCPPPGQECQVGLDGLFGIDSFVAHRDIDIPVPSDNLGDVRGKSVHNGFGDKEPPEIVRGIAQGAAVGGVNESGVQKGRGEQVTGDVGADPAVLGAEPALE